MEVVRVQEKKAQLSVLSNKRNLPENLLQSIQADTPMKVGVAWSGYCDQIRNKPKAMIATYLVGHFPRLASAYGARQELQEYTLEKCVDLIMKRFSFLGIQEIDEAFEMAAAGHFGFQIEMYGSFDAGILGKVLTHYAVSRKDVIAKVEKELGVAAKEISLAEIQQRNAHALAMFPQELEEKKSSIESWEQVPVMWSKFAWKLEMLKFDDEIREAYLKKAMPLARAEFLKYCGGLAHIAAVTERTAYLRGERADKVLARAKVIAKKMVVYDQLIYSKNKIK